LNIRENKKWYDPHKLTLQRYLEAAYESPEKEKKGKSKLSLTEITAFSRHILKVISEQLFERKN